MGNKLKKMLSNDDNGYKLSLGFESPKQKEAFIKALEEVSRTGKIQEIVGVNSIEKKCVDGSGEYPIEHYELFGDAMIGPVYEKFEFPVWIDNQEHTVIFSRNISEQRVHLVLDNLETVKLDIKFDKLKKQVSFKYTTRLEKAGSMDILIFELKLFVALINSFFKEDCKNEKIETTEKYYKQLIVYLSLITELAEVLSIKIQPAKVLKEENEDYTIEELYLLLVKKEIIRKNDKLTRCTDVIIDDSQVGTELFAAYYEHGQLSFLGEKRNIYAVRCVFGAILKEVIEDVDGKKVAYFEDDQEKPMYISSFACLTEEEAKSEMENIQNRILEYRDAKHFKDELISLYSNVNQD